MMWNLTKEGPFGPTLGEKTLDTQSHPNFINSQHFLIFFELHRMVCALYTSRATDKSRTQQNLFLWLFHRSSWIHLGSSPGDQSHMILELVNLKYVFRVSIYQEEVLLWQVNRMFTFTIKLSNPYIACAMHMCKKLKRPKKKVFSED